MKSFSRILLIINIRTGIVAALSVVSTALCLRFNVTADFPLTLIATAVIFPIVFSISGAYKRRESALRDYGNLKAHGRAIYLAARDWLDEREPEKESELRNLLGQFFKTCRDLLTGPVVGMDEREDAVHRALSNLSLHIRGMRRRGLATGEVSRCNQYLSKMIAAFESLKHIYQYRTPRTLRAYADVFIIVLPVVYGPYFALISSDFARGLEYLMPVLFSVVLVSLANIQDHLENPFDQVGEDDIELNAEKFVTRLERM